MGSVVLPPSNGKIILISGINGYIASAIGLALLKEGYILRGTARAKHTADALVNGAYKDYASRVEMLSVPDMTIPGAFDEAVKGTCVTSIIHTASPINFSFTKWAQFVPPAVAGVTSILASSLTHAGPQLESFVLTSSVAAIVELPKKPYAFSEADWNTYSEAECLRLGDAAPSGLLYQASKTRAERTMWAFRDEKKPPFAISAVNPAVVVGPPVQLPPSPDLLNETLKPVWELFSGAVSTIPAAIGSASYVDIRDVTALHVWCATHPAEANGERYLAANGRGTPQAMADVLRRAYPERKGVIPEGFPGGDYDTKGFGWVEGGQSFESGKAKAVLGGREWVGFERSILETTKAFERYL